MIPVGGCWKSYGDRSRNSTKPRRSEQGITQACWEIFRLELVGEADYGFEDVVASVKWYVKR